MFHDKASTQVAKKERIQWRRSRAASIIVPIDGSAWASASSKVMLREDARISNGLSERFLINTLERMLMTLLPFRNDIFSQSLQINGVATYRISSNNLWMSGANMNQKGAHSAQGKRMHRNKFTFDLNRYGLLLLSLQWKLQGKPQGINGQSFCTSGSLSFWILEELLSRAPAWK